MHKIENMPLQTPVLDRWANLPFFQWYPLCSYILIGNQGHVKSSGIAPRLANARTQGSAKFANAPPLPHPRDWEGGQMPRSSPWGGGGGTGPIWNWLMHYIPLSFYSNLLRPVKHIPVSCWRNQTVVELRAIDDPVKMLLYY